MNLTENLVQEVQKVIVGKEDVIKNVLMAILAKGHILLEDIPGVGKTTLALAFSKALGMEYKRIQFTPDVIPSDVVGFSIYDKKTDSFVYKEGAVMCNLLLADEINRTSSKTQAALLEVMEAGTQMLPQSQLDRFMVKLSMGYPDFESQVNILKDRQTEQPLDSIHEVVSKEEVLNMQQEVIQVTVKENILRYITALVEKTRTHELISLGVSPRGALAVNNMAKAAAYVKGRDYVVPEDVMEIFVSVCAHRVILHPRAKVSNPSAEEIIGEIVRETKAAELV